MARSIIGAINGARVMALVFSGNANDWPRIERAVALAANEGVTLILREATFSRKREKVARPRGSPNPALRAKIRAMNAQLRPKDLPITTQAAEGLPRRRFSVAEIEAMVRAGVIDADERLN